MKNKKIGIWGLGKVGKSAVRYFYSQGYQIELIEARQLCDTEKNFLQKYTVHLYNQKNQKELYAFLEYNDFIFPSPGINLKKYAKYSSKWITELNVIRQNCMIPLVGITGTVGKTSVVNILSHLLQASTPLRIWTGGNIGTPMLDLLTHLSPVDLAILEISSFQLEHCKVFSPDFAIWTNFHPNHLDRHGTIKNYFNAKKKILNFQNAQQTALLPLTLIDQLQPLNTIKSKLCFFSEHKPSCEQIKCLRKQDQFFYLHNNEIIEYAQEAEKIIGSIANFAPITFKQNLLIILSAYHIINRRYKLSEINACDIEKIKLPGMEHRLEKVTTINGIDIYNDSKSTTSVSTLAAVNQLCKKPIILLLGGLSKGVSRDNLIQQLKNKVVIIHSFGKEAVQIKQLCRTYNIPCHSFANLYDATIASFQRSSEGYLILLSPGGSSFDLFTNYQERGNYFKKTIHNLAQNVPMQIAKKEASSLQ